jgi:fructoselysine-6-P-deglycase FrlB-like protein
MVEPDRVLDDCRRESVSLVGVGGSIHAAMVAQAKFTSQYLLSHVPGSGSISA